MAEDVNLYNANDGLLGRDGGPYLDLEEARIAEERRARVEGREPDYDHPGVSAGIQLVPASQLVQHQLLVVPSRDGTTVQADAAAAIANSDIVAAEPSAVIPGDVLQAEADAANPSTEEETTTDEEPAPAEETPAEAEPAPVEEQPAETPPAEDTVFGKP